LQVVQYLVEQCRVDMNTVNINGDTPLHIVCRYGKLPVVQYLETAGANIQALNINGHTPLHAARESGKLAVVRYLVEKWPILTQET
jgi:ankyrin repeat protein